jgi:hypothetical protein
VRVRAPGKRFVIKGNGICDRSARSFDGHKAKLHRFFSLRTIRVVTRDRANLTRIPVGLSTNPQSLFSSVPRSPFMANLLIADKRDGTGIGDTAIGLRNLWEARCSSGTAGCKG